MKQVLVLEHIGRKNDQQQKLYRSIAQELAGMGDFFKTPSSKPWVAKITGLSDKFGFQREFVKGVADYSQSSGNGNRGVNFRFVIEEGPIYERFYKRSWKSSEREFFKFCEGNEKILSKDEVLECLS